MLSRLFKSDKKRRQQKLNELGDKLNKYQDDEDKIKFKMRNKEYSDTLLILLSDNIMTKVKQRKSKFLQQHHDYVTLPDGVKVLKMSQQKQLDAIIGGCAIKGNVKLVHRIKRLEYQIKWYKLIYNLK